MERYNSRFITYDDDMSDKVLLKIPHEWWSRLYEYIWAASFAEESDTCLDAACGILHPFKFFLASKCEKAYGCDLREIKKENVIKEMAHYFDKEDINLAMSYYEKLDLRTYNLTNLGYESNTFHKVYCISTLEHLNPKDIELALKEMYRVLKPEGLLILTVDYPSVNLDNLIRDIAAVGFKFVGEVDTTKPNNAIYSRLLGGLNCYRILVEK